MDKSEAPAKTHDEVVKIAEAEEKAGIVDQQSASALANEPDAEKKLKGE